MSNNYTKTFALMTIVVSVLMMNFVTPIRAGVIKSNKKELCNENIPCGWAIYSPFVRKIDYFVKNACLCAPDLKCTRTHDDLSVSAYVYHCLPDKRSTTESSSGA